MGMASSRILGKSLTERGFYNYNSTVTFIWETGKYHFGLQSVIVENVGINYLYLYLDF